MISHDILCVVLRISTPTCCRTFTEMTKMKILRMQRKSDMDRRAKL